MARSRSRSPVDRRRRSRSRSPRRDPLRRERSRSCERRDDRARDRNDSDLVERISTVTLDEDNDEREMIVLNESTNGEPAEKIVRREEEAVITPEMQHILQDSIQRFENLRGVQRSYNIHEASIIVLDFQSTNVEKCDALSSVRRLVASEQLSVHQVVNKRIYFALHQTLLSTDVNLLSESVKLVEELAECGYYEDAVIAPLIQLMMHTNLIVAEQATCAVGNIAYGSAKLRDLVIQSNGIEALMHLCGKIEELSATFLISFSRVTGNMCRFWHSNMPLQVADSLLQCILRLIRCEDIEVRVISAWSILWYSQGGAKQVNLIGDSDSILSHINKLFNSGNDRLVVPALKVLVSLITGSESLKQSVINLGALRVLPEVARKTSRLAVLAEICDFIENILRGKEKEQQRQAVIDNELLSMIIMICQLDDVRCQFQAMTTLQYFLDGATPSQILALLSMKPFPSLAALLAIKDVDIDVKVLYTLEAILTAVAKARPNELDAVRKEVEESGMIGHLERIQMNNEEETANMLAFLIMECHFGDISRGE